MADKIIEILESSRLEKVANVCDSEKARTINLSNRVWELGWHLQLDDITRLAWLKGFVF